MGKDTGISWTDATWNPWRGCTKVSRACDHCYMFRDQRRYGRDPEIVVRAKPATFNAPLKWDEPRLIFTCSWSDWFHIDADPWRDEAWEIVRACPQHTFQILTKRPGRILRCLPDDWGDGYPNVWLGVSIEDAAVLHRVHQLRAIPAALRFISAEPLLGSLYESAGAVRCPTGLACTGCRYCETERERRERDGGRSLDLDGIGWVIVGGESGSRSDARPMHPTWAREIRDATISRGIPYHFKQWGSWAPAGFVSGLDDGKGATVVVPGDPEWHGVYYRGASPKSGGKLLDGVEWCEIPDRALMPA